MENTNIQIKGNGNKSVIISNQNTAGIFESNLWIGEQCGYTCAKHKTLLGAKRWAKKTLSHYA